MIFGISEIGNGEIGTDQTVKAMSDLVARSLLRPELRLFTLSLLNAGHVSSKKEINVAHVIFNYVKKNISYIKDPVNVESIQDPISTLKIKAGDCDDHSILIAAMFESVGIKSRFVVIGNDVDNFQHIYTQVFINNKWLPVDTTLDRPLGSSAKMLKTKIYDKGFAMVNRIAGTRPVILSSSNRRKIQDRVYAITYKKLNDAWNAGHIGMNELHNYVRMIDGSSSPSRGSAGERSFRDAITSMLRSKSAAGFKYDPLSGLSDGLAGFFGDLWGDVKSEVGSSIQNIKSPAVGTSGQRPLINIPAGLISTTVSPEAASAAAVRSTQELMQNPFVIAAGVAVITILVTKMFSR